jgi:hypothetical protein
MRQNAAPKVNTESVIEALAVAVAQEATGAESLLEKVDALKAVTGYLQVILKLKKPAEEGDGSSTFADFSEAVHEGTNGTAPAIRSRARRAGSPS